MGTCPGSHVGSHIIWAYEVYWNLKEEFLNETRQEPT